MKLQKEKHNNWDDIETKLRDRGLFIEAVEYPGYNEKDRFRIVDCNNEVVSKQVKFVKKFLYGTDGIK